MLYKELIPPFELVMFEEMNKKQVQQYFDWFMDTLEERIDYLEKFINQEGGGVVLNKSIDSLISLWEWFEPRIELCPKTEEEIVDEIEARPDWMRENISPKKFSIQTLMIAVDISAYFGEVVIANNPQIHWGYRSKPKKLHGVNRPSLLGFAGDMIDFVYGRIEVCMWRSIREPDKMNLYNSYHKCMKMM